MASAATPQPMEGLLDAGPPQFIIKTYEIVEDSNTNHIVSWSSSNVSFVVWDPQTFSISLLPRYFKHNNFSSFVRQLNVYGFRKVDPDRWEFANEGFLRGERHLLKNIRRRKQLQLQASQALNACVEVGRSGLDGEADRVRRDKQVLMVELVKLRQKQQNTREYLHAMEQRLRKTEMKQQQVMMSFWARAMQNPHFVQQFVQQKDRRKEFEEGIARKKRRFVKMKPEEFGDKQGLCDCLNINPLEKFVEEEDHHEHRSIINNVKFWEDFWSEDIEEEGEQREGLDMLVELLGFKGSSSK